MVDILVGCCRFDLQAGHTELAIARIQASLEFSLLAPAVSTAVPGPGQPFLLSPFQNHRDDVTSLPCCTALACFEDCLVQVFVLVLCGGFAVRKEGRQKKTYSWSQCMVAGGDSVRRQLFEQFWVSRAPLIGEEGADGWQAWEQHQQERRLHAELPPPPPLPPEEPGMSLSGGAAIKHQSCFGDGS